MARYPVVCTGDSEFCNYFIFTLLRMARSLCYGRWSYFTYACKATSTAPSPTGSSDLSVLADGLGHIPLEFYPPRGFSFIQECD